MLSPDTDSVSWLRFAFASLTVVSLMGALAWGLKFVTMRGWIKPRCVDKRLDLVSSLQLDARRRLVVAKWDSTEYLLLLGSGNDLLLSEKPSSDDRTP